MEKADSYLPDNSGHQEEEKFLVVGLGASAGGLKALQNFFEAVPDRPDMAFIIVVHLAPDHKSSMSELLQEYTSLKVSQLDKRTQVRPNHVYVIPPGKLLKMEDNHLVLFDPEKISRKLTTIDLFFRSLGKAKGNYSACVILSGSGSDGALGLKTIKEFGGIVISQDPQESAYSGMPRSAIDTGLVDFTLPVQEIPEKLMDYKKSLLQITLSGDIEGLANDEAEALKEIFLKIDVKTGHNFTNYKRKSVLRRIERRMRVNHVETLPEYLEYINNNPGETNKLFKDLLISVTHFFRDKEAFRELESNIIPQLFEQKLPGDQIRIWVPGCATGEEAYSIAMQLLDFAQTLDNPPQIQLFATDIDREALKVARDGQYPETIEADISQDRLERFFTKQGYAYQVKPQVKDIILFAAHDLLKDPPFSKLDLISCRNLLIYLDRNLQTKVFNLFHYALNSGKWLFLGISDSILEAKELFKAVSKKFKIYKQIPVPKSQLRLPKFPLIENQNFSTITKTRHWHSKPDTTIEELHYKLLVGKFAPPSVIINKNHDVIHATTGIDPFLKYSGGEPSQNILEMVIPEIRQVLRRLLFQAEQDEKNGSTVKKTYLTLEGIPKAIKIIVQKITAPNAPEGLFLIVFLEESEPNKPDTSGLKDIEKLSDTDAKIIKALENELEHVKEELNTSVEDYETSTEELRASNEELQSMNEELQSTTEQLETSQEELQSVNEELKSVNRELEKKVDELDRSNEHLKNLMDATEIAAVFVDRECRIKFYTSPSTELFNLIPSDEGRPFKHITHNLQYEDLLNDVTHVLECLESVEKNIRDEKGNHYLLRMRPYRTTGNKVAGVVLTFINVTQLKLAEQELAQRAIRQDELSQLSIFALKEQALKEIIKKATQCLCKVLDIDYCLVFQMSGNNNIIQLLHSNTEEIEISREEIPLNDDLDVGLAKNAEGPLITKSYPNEQSYRLLPELEHLDIASGIVISIGGKADNLGLLCLYSQELKDFKNPDIHFIQIVAHVIGTAIERHLLNNERSKITERLKNAVNRSERFQREILDNSLSERWKLGEYLHDNLAQNLASIKIMIGSIKSKLPSDSRQILKDLEEVNNLIDKQIEAIRNLSHEIIPIDVEEEGVSHAFQLLARQTEKVYDVTCTLKVDAIIDKIKNRELSTNLHHITQEAIKNAISHGKAGKIEVVLKEEKDNLLLKIQDDGIGFSAGEQEGEGLGLRIMQHRVELLGGSFRLEALPDEDEYNTSITCRIPLESLELEE